MAHTDEQKQMALTTYAACRNNATQAAKFCREHYDFAVSPDTITMWARGEYIAPQLLSSAEQLLQPVADRLENLSHKIVDEMMETIGEASFSQLAFALNGAIDKMLLLRGQANQIQGREISREEAALRLAEMIVRHGTRSDTDTTGD